MATRFIKAVTLVALAVFSTLALADPPARVGRVALAEGQVSISSEVGDEAGAALVNWPVTSHNQITTGRGARTEIRVGSTALRLDANSSIKVSELDDDSLRLHLNYGSVSVRVRNAEVLPGFELSTPNGSIRLQEPGGLRVDAERVRGTTAVTVFDGVAMVQDRGTQLIVRAGKRAEISDDDVRTGLAARDGFDDWAQLRDQRDDRSTSARYVTSEMTGYEELDQNGTWRDDAEYGPLWLPRAVAPDWAPYRDGSWTWVSPWGWTWVDNAPWGYAPFHYGRWVFVNQRWGWAPGRHIGRPVWAPALVGWVGGAGWNLGFGAGGGHHARPAQGWYPLSPRDSFVPGYRLSHDHLQRINRDARPDGRGDRRGRDGHDGRRENHRDGLTVVPHDQFGRRGTIAVRNAPKAVVPPLALQNAPATAPAAPQGVGRDHGDRFDRSGRGARIDRDDMQRNRPHRPELTGVPAQRGPSANPAQPTVSGQPQAPAPSPFSRRDGRPAFEDRGERQQQVPAPAAVMPAPVIGAPAPIAAPSPLGRREGRPEFEERRLRHQPSPAPVAARPAGVMPPAAAPMPMPQPFMPPPAAPMPMPQPFMPPAAAPLPMPQPIMPPPAAEQRGRQFRNDGERRMREPDAGQAAPAQPPRQFAPPVFHQQSAPVFHQQSAPVAPAAPAPMPAPAPLRQAPPQAAQAAQQAAPAAAGQASAPERRQHSRRDGERER